MRWIGLCFVVLVLVFPTSAVCDQSPQELAVRLGELDSETMRLMRQLTSDEKAGRKVDWSVLKSNPIFDEKFRIEDQLKKSADSGNVDSQFYFGAYELLLGQRASEATGKEAYLERW